MNTVQLIRALGALLADLAALTTLEQWQKIRDDWYAILAEFGGLVEVSRMLRVVQLSATGERDNLHATVMASVKGDEELVKKFGDGTFFKPIIEYGPQIIQIFTMIFGLFPVPTPTPTPATA